MQKHISALILLLVLAGAMLFSANPDPKAIVAQVGTRTYNYKSFNDGFKAYLQYHAKNVRLTQQDSVNFNNKYWEELVGIYIYDQAIQAGRVKVTDAELEAEVKKNIPEGVKQIKDFHTNGKFDKKKFEKGLADNPGFKKEVLDFTRDLYTYNKLINAIKNEVKANPDSVKANWLKENDFAEATIIHFDYTKLTNITVNDDEAWAYYNAHQEEYKRTNGRGYLLVRFPGALSKSEASEAIAKDNKNKSAALYTRAKEVGLAKAAEEMNLNTENTPLFNTQDEIIPFVGRAPSLITFAYENTPGAIPEIFYAPTGDILVLELNREAEEYYIDFEIKKQEVLIKATRTKRMYYMDEYVQNFLKNETPDTYLQTARRDSISIVEFPKVTRDNDLKPLPRFAQLNETILATPEGNWTSLIEKDRMWYLAKVVKRHTPDPKLWEKDKKSLIDAANAQIQQDHLNKWYLERRSKIEIKDNRHEFYPIRQMIKLQ